MLSAQAILQTAQASGKHDFKPENKSLSTIIAAFRKLGFQTGHFAGNSLSITADVSTFEKVFQISIVSKGNEHLVQWKDGELNSHFPLQDLPKSLKDLILTVVLPDAPDFGPGNY